MLPAAVTARCVHRGSTSSFCVHRGSTCSVVEHLALLGTPCAMQQLPCGHPGPADASFSTGTIAAMLPLQLPELYRWALVFPYSNLVSQQPVESVFSELGSCTGRSAGVELKGSTLQSRRHGAELLGDEALHTLTDVDAATARKVQQQLELQRKQLPDKWGLLQHDDKKRAQAQQQQQRQEEGRAATEQLLVRAGGVPQLLTAPQKRRYLRQVLGQHPADMDDSALDDAILSSIPAGTSFGAADQVVLEKASHPLLASLCVAAGLQHTGTKQQLAARLGSLAQLPQLQPSQAEEEDAAAANADVAALHAAVLLAGVEECSGEGSDSGDDNNWQFEGACDSEGYAALLQEVQQLLPEETWPSSASPADVAANASLTSAAVPCAVTNAAAANTTTPNSPVPTAAAQDDPLLLQQQHQQQQQQQDGTVVAVDKTWLAWPGVEEQRSTAYQSDGLASMDWHQYQLAQQQQEAAFSTQNTAFWGPAEDIAEGDTTEAAAEPVSSTAAAQPEIMDEKSAVQAAGEEADVLKGRHAVLISGPGAQPQYGWLVLSKHLDKRTAQVYVLGPDGKSLVSVTAKEFVAALSTAQCRHWKKHVHVWPLEAVQDKPQQLLEYHAVWQQQQQQGV